MSTLSAALNVAKNSLMAASGGTSVAGENITGANTPGYVRRAVQLENNPLGGGQPGGVRWVGTARAFDVFAFSNLVGETSAFGAAQARAEALTTIEGALAPAPDATIGDAFNDFFAAFDQLGQTPDDPTARAEVMQSSEEIRARFNAASTGLMAVRGEIFSDAQAQASEVNERLTKIAQLNGKIASQPGETSGKAELMDQRDELVRQVSERIEVDVLQDDKGRVTLLSSGTALLEGTRASSVVISLDPNQNMTIGVQRGATIADITGRLTGGTLAGLREARDLDVVALHAGLDQLAFDFADAVNQAHQTGLDLNGAPGAAFFTDSGGSPLGSANGAAAAIDINPALLADSARIAAASAAAPPPGGNATALAISAIQTQNLASGRTPGEAFGDLAGDVGRRINGAQTEQSLRESTVDFAIAEQQKSSGVSLEEELLELSKFQRAFEASTKVLQTINEMLDEVVRSF